MEEEREEITREAEGGPEPAEVSLITAFAVAEKPSRKASQPATGAISSTVEPASRRERH